MLPLQKIITQWIKALFSDMRSAIVAIVLTSLVVGSGGLLLFVESAKENEVFDL